MLYFRYYSFRCAACGRKYTDSLSPFLLGTGAGSARGATPYLQMDLGNGPN